VAGTFECGSINTGNLLTSCKTIIFSIRTLLREVSNVVIVRHVLCFTAFCMRIRRAGRKLGSFKLPYDGLEYPL